MRIEFLVFLIGWVHHHVVLMRSNHPIDPESERLVSAHLPYVRARALRFAGRGESLDDLVQVASLGLVAAAQRFDPARGVPFLAYAVPTIDGELRKHLRDRAATIRIPRREQDSAVRIRRAAAAVSQRLGREPSIAEAATAAGMGVGEAHRALELPRNPTPLTEFEEQRSSAADEAIDACELRAVVRAGLHCLDARERVAIMLRFEEDLAQAEIGRRLGISQSQASRLLATALAKLRRELATEWNQAA